MKVRRTAIVAAVLAQCAMLAACGGGGGATMPTVPDNGWSYPPPGNPNNPEPPPPPPPKPSDAPQYNINPALRMTGYAVAHDAGFVGSGVTVAVIDSGFDRAAYGAEFGDRLLAGWDLIENKSGVDVDRRGHGTKMSRIIAASGVWPGEPNKVTMVGVAPGANIYPVRAGGGVITKDLEAYDHIRQVSDVKIVNMSYGADFVAEAEIAQQKSALLGLKQAGKLMVAAAGNSGGSFPDYPARLAADGDLASHMIVAGAVNDDKTIASYSNRPGETANRYLVAPALFNFGEVQGYFIIREGGTSNATAVISGAAAVVWGRWQYLSADQVANILLETAEDLGDPGVDPVYGRGLLRLDRAMQPIGELNTLSITGQRLPLGTLAGVVPQGTHSALSGLKVQTLDDYGRNYQVSAQQLLGREPVATAAQQRDAMLQDSREVYASEQGGMSFAWAGAGGRASPWAKVGFAGSNWAASAYSGTMFAPLALTDNPLMGRLREAAGVDMSRDFGGFRLQAGVVSGQSLTNHQQTALHAGLDWRAGAWRFEASVGRGLRQIDNLDVSQNQTTFALGAGWQEGARHWGVALHQGVSRQTLAAGLGSTQTQGSALVLRYTDQDVGRYVGWDGARLTAAMTVGAPVRTKAALVLPTTIDAQTGVLGFERVNLDVKSRAPVRLDLAYSAPIQKGTLRLGASASNTAGAAASVTWSRPF
jgi:hypothetical protein